MIATHFALLLASPSPAPFIGRRMAFGTKRVPEAAELRLSGPMSGEQKLGDGLWELPLVGSDPLTRDKA
jgi:hypothetical protein